MLRSLQRKLLHGHNFCCSSWYHFHPRNCCWSSWICIQENGKQSKYIFTSIHLEQAISRKRKVLPFGNTSTVRFINVVFKYFFLQVEDIADKSLEDAVSKYFNSEQPGAKELLDWAQKEFKCCGVNGTSDYIKPSSGNTTDFCDANGGVKTCYKDEDCSGTPYDKGCSASFADFVRHNLAVIGAVAIGIAFIQVSNKKFYN